VRVMKGGWTTVPELMRTSERERPVTLTVCAKCGAIAPGEEEGGRHVEDAARAVRVLVLRERQDARARERLRLLVAERLVAGGRVAGPGGCHKDEGVRPVRPRGEGGGTAMTADVEQL